MARLRTSVDRAAGLHRHAAGLVTFAGQALDQYAPAAAPVEQYAEQHLLAARMRADTAVFAPGWVGAPLDAMSPNTPIGGALIPTHVQVGQAHPLDDARFPVVVPLLGVGHLAVDADARDPRVAGLLRSLLLRLLAAAPPATILIRAVDAAGAGTTLDAFTGIAEIMPPPATDWIGLQAVLTEAEEWVRAAERAAEPVTAAVGLPQGGLQPHDGTPPQDRTADLSPPRHLIVLIASLPELTEGADLVRIAALAKAGPDARLHLVVAGWPPPPLTAETTQPPLPRSTQVTVRNPYAWVGNPPGDSFAAQRTRPGAPAGGAGIMPGRLNAPMYLDPDPPVELIHRVCEQVAVQLAGGGRPTAPAGADVAGAWRDYVSTAQRLDVVRQEAAAVVADQTAAVRTVRDELMGVRTRLAQERDRLVEVARGAGTPAPPGLPGPADLAAAAAYPMDSPAAVSAALSAAHDALDGAHSLLSTVESRRPYLRNGSVYGVFAAVAVLAQIAIFALASETSPLAVLAIPCGLVLPAIAFVLGWLTVGLFGPDPGEESPDRTAGFGVFISALGALPLLAMVAWVALSAIRA